MINMTLVQIITTFLQLLLVVWFHFVLIIYNSLSPQPTPPSSALSLGLELIPLVSASTSSSCLCPQPQPSAPHLGLCYCINVLTLLNISASHHMILFFLHSFLNPHYVSQSVYDLLGHSHTFPTDVNVSLLQKAFDNKITAVLPITLHTSNSNFIACPLSYDLCVFKPASLPIQLYVVSMSTHLSWCPAYV